MTDGHTDEAKDVGYSIQFEDMTEPRAIFLKHVSTGIGANPVVAGERVSASIKVRR